MIWTPVEPVPITPTRLPCQHHRVLWPVEGVERLTIELFHTVVARQGRCRQDPNRGEQKPTGQFSPVLQFDGPKSGIVVICATCHHTAKMHVPAQIELVDNVVQVLQRLWLSSKVLTPVPLVEQFLGERVPIGVALRVEACAGITIPIPGTPRTCAGLQHGHIDPQLDKTIQLVDSTYPSANNDRLMLWTGPCGARLSRIKPTNIIHGNSIYRGILTGYSEAFVVDQSTRDALVSEDPRSDELLKPILRGRDIARYYLFCHFRRRPPGISFSNSSKLLPCV